MTDKQSTAWVGLTVGETAIIMKMLERGNFFVAIAAIEDKLKSKNERKEKNTRTTSQANPAVPENNCRHCGGASNRICAGQCRAAPQGSDT